MALCYLFLRIAGAEFQDPDELSSGGAILITLPKGSQIVVKDGESQCQQRMALA